MDPDKVSGWLSFVRTLGGFGDGWRLLPVLPPKSGDLQRRRGAGDSERVILGHRSECGVLGRVTEHACLRWLRGTLSLLRSWEGSPRGQEPGGCGCWSRAGAVPPRPGGHAQDALRCHASPPPRSALVGVAGPHYQGSNAAGYRAWTPPAPWERTTSCG